MRKAKAGLIVVAGLMGASAAWAHGGATGIVKERMDAMSDISRNVKSVGKMLKGGAYDPERVAEAGNEIADHAGRELTKLFPAGSLEKSSEASPAIWKDWPQFEEYAGDLEEAALALKELAEDGGDKKAVAGAFGDLAGTCKTCHQSFRIKK